MGNNIVRQLLAEGRAVRAMANHSSAALAGLDIEQVRADVRKFDEVKKAMQDVDVVYHAAGVVPLDSTAQTQALLHDVNVNGKAALGRATGRGAEEVVTVQGSGFRKTRHGC